MGGQRDHHYRVSPSSDPHRRLDAVTIASKLSQLPVSFARRASELSLFPSENYVPNVCVYDLVSCLEFPSCFSVMDVLALDVAIVPLLVGQIRRASAVTKQVFRDGGYRQSL